MSIDTSDEKLENMEDFAKLEITKNLSETVIFNWKLALCFFVPYLGDIFDLLRISSYNGMEYVRAYIQNVINSRSETKSGRTKDFINLMIENKISETEAKTVSRVKC